MIDAGIMNGLSRGGATVASKTSARSPKKPVPRAPTPVSVLTNAGFIRLGDWTADGNGKIELSVPAPSDSGVYAFATKGVVRYVGLTRVGFNKRMQNYGAGNVRQRTNHRINAVILEHLGAGMVVEIYLGMSTAMNWNGCQ